MPGKVIGIDLGTTNSVVAVMEGDQAVVVVNEEGSRVTPSVVAPSPRRRAPRRPGREAAGGDQPGEHDLLDQALHGPQVRRPRSRRGDQRVPYKVDAPRRTATRGSRCGAKATLAAGDLRDDPPEAEEDGGGLPRGAGDRGRHHRAGELQRPPARGDQGRRPFAGLEVLRILNEPTAAALAYGFGKTSAERIAVYDFGGGTFDVSLLDLGEHVFEVHATDGNTFLGGDDFDHRSSPGMSDDFMKRVRLSISRKDRMALQRFREAAEKANIELSTRGRNRHQPAVHHGRCRTGPSIPVYADARASSSSSPDLVATDVRAGAARRSASRASSAREIDQVLLVGGSTRMPLVQQRVEEFFGRSRTAT